MLALTGAGIGFLPFAPSIAIEPDFAVVLGTLVLQGITFKPIMRALRLDADLGARHDISRGRTAMLQAAIDTLKADGSAEAAAVRAQSQAAAEIANSSDHRQAATVQDRLRLTAVWVQRSALRLWKSGTIGDDAFRLSREELDRSELDAAPAGHFQPLAIDGLHPARPADADDEGNEGADPPVRAFSGPSSVAQPDLP